MKSYFSRFFGNPYIASGLVFALLCLNCFLNLPGTQFLYFLIGAWVVLAILARPLRERIMDRFGQWFTPGRTIALFILLLIYLFQVRFPFRDWSRILFEDDYISGYVASVKGMAALKEGGLFGWDPKIFCGYPQVVEAPMNKAMFLWPFAALLGPAAGRSAFILFFFLLFPFLGMLYARVLFRDRTQEALTFAFSSLFLISFFRNFLTFGMVDALMGLDFFTLNLILYEKVKEEKAWAAFALSVSLTCTMYAHIGLFFISLFFIAVELATGFSKRLLYLTFVVFFLSFFMTLHNTFYFLYYRAYFPLSALYYNPASDTLGRILADDLKYYVQLLDFSKAFTIRYNLENLLMAFLPLLAFKTLKGEGRSRKIAVYLLLIPFIKGCEFPGTMVITFRIVFVISLFLPVLLGAFLRQEFRERRLHNLALLPLFFLPTLGTHTWYRMHYIDSLEKEYPAVERAVKAMDGHQILLELVSHGNAMTDKENLRTEFPRAEEGVINWENLFSLELPDKKFLSSTAEIYHFYRFRDYIISGAFRGRPIGDCPIGEFNAFLQKWGAKYLVVWSERSVDYFSRASGDYELMLQSGRWHIFKFLKSDIRGVVLRNGEGQYEDIGYFGKTLMLSNAIKGDTAVLRENYFPSWRAFWKGGEVPVINAGDQMAVVAPENGNVEIDLRFPKYHIFTILAIISILCSFAFFIWPGLSRFVIPPEPEGSGKNQG
jgi:hypothetical protein